jgi:hypothetical protein
VTWHKWKSGYPEVVNDTLDVGMAHAAARDRNSDVMLTQFGWLVREWLESVGAAVLEPGSPWANGYIESFKGKLRDEFLNREIFYTLQEAKN